MELTGLDLSLGALRTAAQGYRRGDDARAIEDIVLGQNWLYEGPPQASFLQENATNADGITLNMRGNDFLILGDRNDIFWSGDGNDLVLGGAREDGLSGGDGNDILAGGDNPDFVGGGDGNDRLFGGTGRDRLEGGNGRDMLFGEEAADGLIGGQGCDLMSGGGGEDTFIFKANDGFDRILDFDPDRDLIDLQGDVGEVTITDVRSGTLIRAEGLTILVQNVASDELVIGDSLFL